MSLATLRIEPGDNGTVRGAKFYLNGQEIGRYARNLKLEFGVDNPLALATVEFLVRPDIPEELIAYIKSESHDPLGLLDKWKKEREEVG